jgi:hypothetical protein
MNARDEARAALAFWEKHPDSPSGYLASALSTLLDELVHAPDVIIGNLPAANISDDSRHARRSSLLR